MRTYGVFPERQVQVGSTLRASTLESGREGGHSSKEKERYKKRDEGGCVSPLAFCPELAHTQRHTSAKPVCLLFSP